MSGDFSELSRRERQIMDILYRREEASIVEICGDLPNPPSTMAGRRMVQILLEKGWVKRRKLGREFIYRPERSADKAGASALERVVDTFFGGSLEAALVSRLSGKRGRARDAEVVRLKAMLEGASRGETRPRKPESS